MALTDDKPTAKKILCDNCDSEDAAQSRCNECGVFLCQFCAVFHKRSRSTKHHGLLTMEEMKSNQSPQTIAEKMRCSKHKQEIIKLFCKTCQKTICRDCTIVDHQGHKYGFVEEVAVDEKQKIKRDLNRVKERKTRVAEGIQNLMKFSQSLEAKKKSTISEIRRHFDQLTKAMGNRKQELVEKATSLTNSKQKQVHAQLEILKMALASCESSIEFTEQAFKNGNDVQILSMEKYILQSLEQLKTAKDQTEPCVTQDMEFVIPSSAQETRKTLLTKYDVCVDVADPANCTASFTEDETVLGTGNKYSITLICNDTNDRRVRYGGQVIKPSFSGMEVRDVAVTDNKDGSYTISFCPDQCGMLSFEVSINEMPAPKCSLTKQVKWVIGDVYGSGAITDGGNTMKGVSRVGQYCWRIGSCSFESGVHTWKVQSRYHDNFRDNYGSYGSYFNHVSNATAEIGIIDCDEINADKAKSRKKWVCRRSLGHRNPTETVSLTLDMENRTLETRSDAGVSFFEHNVIGFGVNNWQHTASRSYANNYQLTASRVLPFFSSNSPHLSLSLVE